MNTALVKEIVEKKYDIHVNCIDKNKNVYHIQAFEGNFCFKIIKYSFGHFLFIINAMRHLQNKGFQNIPKFIVATDGKDYIEIENKYAYLTEWIDARVCDYEKSLDLIRAVSKLAELHKKSVGFQVTKNMKPRIGWLQWIKVFETRTNEILDFKKRIDDKNNKTEFDLFYLDMMNKELQRSEKAIENLKKSKYVSKMKKEIIKKGFCHHDYAHHNVLISKEGTVTLIDFDYCMLDTHLHDLASILIRTMKNGKWSMQKALFILNSYHSINKVYEDDIPIISAFMEFPQAYWQVGIQYYWEKQPWGEEFFLNKLNKIYMDNEQRKTFINKFRYFKYDI
ncbi:CotS family spore coat protein [Haloimpatiens sp. FM7330]|uniref:CotS family spore coat protein n=1 Tax=Haloimpatiens sp. FM7330 TaxID=3298610 RepID=UPI00363D1FA8